MSNLIEVSKRALEYLREMHHRQSGIELGALPEKTLPFDKRWELAEGLTPQQRWAFVRRELAGLVMPDRRLGVNFRSWLVGIQEGTVQRMLSPTIGDPLLEFYHYRQEHFSPWQNPSFALELGRLHKDELKLSVHYVDQPDGWPSSRSLYIGLLGHRGRGRVAVGRRIERSLIDMLMWTVIPVDPKEVKTFLQDPPHSSEQRLRAAVEDIGGFGIARELTRFANSLIHPNTPLGCTE